MNLSGIGARSISSEKGDWAALLRARLFGAVALSVNPNSPSHNPVIMNVPDVDRILANANDPGVYGTPENGNGPSVNGDRTARIPGHGYLLRSQILPLRYLGPLFGVCPLPPTPSLLPIMQPFKLLVSFIQ